MKKNLKIDFIGIGASRSGTTWISKCLSEHPQINFSKEKEVHFFDSDTNYKKGIEYYKNYFEVANNKVTGEFTPNYFNDIKTAERIHKHFPNTKIIACLRNPINRAYSQFFYKRAKGQDESMTFEDVLANQYKNYYIKRGKYYDNLAPYYKFFREDKILVLKYEDIKNNEVDFMKKIYRFLEVDENFVAPSTIKIVNASSINESLVFSKSLSGIFKIFREKRNSPFVKIIKSIAKPLGLLDLAKKASRLNQSKMHSKIEKKPEIKRETRELLKEEYSRDIEKLSSLTGINFNTWLN